MSRETFYQNDRLTVVRGVDHIQGSFIQLYDNKRINETPEGEGLVFDWSIMFGVTTNLTNELDNTNLSDIINNYVSKNK